MQHATKSRGFSALELLIAIAILTILALFGVPNMRTLMQSNRMVVAKNALVVTLQRARMESASTSRHAVVCPSANGHSCLTVGDWSQGWLVYRDDNENGRFDPVESLLQVHQMTFPDLHVRTSDGRRKVTYRDMGRADGTNVTFVFCDGRGDGAGGQVIVANSGRVRSLDRVTPGSCRA
jgi:type IV fimbrial biogenesis protein FimT